MKMNIKRIIVTLLFALLMITIAPNLCDFNGNVKTAEAATVKISKKKATLIKGQALKLKITGTKAKVKWSSSKKSVATVSSKGVVKAKKKGTATITAKVGKKKYKCVVTVKDPQKIIFSEKTAKSKIVKKTIGANGKIFVLLESHYSCPTGISAKCTFYDASGNPVDYDNDSVSFLEKGHTGVLEFQIPDVEYSTYKIVYEYSEGLKYFYHKPVVDNMSLHTNRVNSTFRDYIMFTFTNSNNYECYYCEAVIIYYDDLNTIIDIDKVSISVPANSSDTDKAYVPYDSHSYDDIPFSRYEAFISWGYHLGK